MKVVIGLGGGGGGGGVLCVCVCVCRGGTALAVGWERNIALHALTKTWTVSVCVRARVRESGRARERESGMGTARGRGESGGAVAGLRGDLHENHVCGASEKVQEKKDGGINATDPVSETGLRHSSD
jgi:hypothetical protein